MNDPKISKNYVVSKGPVNRRTTPNSLTPTTKESPLVKVRVQIAKARQRLGVPLSQRLTAEHSGTSHRKKLSFASILQAIGGTVSAIGLMLALIQGSAVMAIFCAALVCWIWRMGLLQRSCNGQRCRDEYIENGPSDRYP
jgi:hypothetical protein